MAIKEKYFIEMFTSQPQYYEALQFFKDNYGFNYDYIQSTSNLGVRLYFDNEEDKVEFMLRWL